LRLPSQHNLGSVGNVGGDVKDPLQSPAFPADHCFRYRQIYRLSTCELVPSIIAEVGTKVVAYPLMPQAVRDYLPVPSAEVGIERVFSGGRDMLGLRRQSMSVETMQWLLLLNEKK
jgi:hypothetical protein